MKHERYEPIWFSSLFFLSIFFASFYEFHRQPKQLRIVKSLYGKQTNNSDKTMPMNDCAMYLKQLRLNTNLYLTSKLLSHLSHILLFAEYFCYRCWKHHSISTLSHIKCHPISGVADKYCVFAVANESISESF